MYFLATGTITKPGEIGPHLQEETRVLNELREQGLVKEAFRKTAGPGVTGILQAAWRKPVRKWAGCPVSFASARMRGEVASAVEAG